MPGEPAAVGHLVVADRLGALDGDARAVGQHAVERLEREARRLQPVDGPGDDADVVEAAVQGGLGEVAGLTRVPADHRVGADDDDRRRTAVRRGRRGRSGCHWRLALRVGASGGAEYGRSVRSTAT